MSPAMGWGSPRLRGRAALMTGAATMQFAGDEAMMKERR